MSTRTMARSPQVLHKDAHTWDPVMMAPRREPSGSFSLTPQQAQLPNPHKDHPAAQTPTPAPAAAPTPGAAPMPETK